MSVFHELRKKDTKILIQELNFRNPETQQFIHTLFEDYRIYEFLILSTYLLFNPELITTLEQLNDRSGYVIVKKNSTLTDDDVITYLSSTVNIGNPILFKFIDSDQVYKLKDCANLNPECEYEKYEWDDFFDPTPFIVDRNFSTIQRNGILYNRYQENEKIVNDTKIMSIPYIKGRTSIFVSNEYMYHVPESNSGIAFILECEKWKK